MEDDGNNGIWAVDLDGTVTNIKMVKKSCNKKAEMMVN